MKIDRKKAFCFILLFLITGCMGCGLFRQKGSDEESEGTGIGTDQSAVTEVSAETDSAENDSQITCAFRESAADAYVDFDMLKEINPDIFAWLYIPGAGIDVPILQSPISDDYYKTHSAADEEDSAGAVYTEMPNLMNMCDFNTIIHGNDLEDAGPFQNLHNFEDSDFFAEHEEFYIYMPDNVLTYEIFLAYYDNDTDILRRHDYTTYAGCQDYLNELYGLRSMNRNFREGWEGLTPYHFLVTLDGNVREDGTQYVVIGALKDDAAGMIDRAVSE